MKRINLKKALLILGIVLAISGIFAYVIIYLNKEPAPQEEIVLPHGDSTFDPYFDSLAPRKDAPDVVNQFNYDLNISVDSIEDNKEGNSTGDKIILKDGSVIYIAKTIKEKKYDVQESANGTLRISTKDNSYMLEIKKINNENYNKIIGVDFSEENNELLNEYKQIKEEYNTIYSNNSEKSSLEYGGIGTFSKMVDFVNNNNLQKEVGIYTSSQVQDIIEKAFNVNLDNKNFGAIEMYKISGKDIISHRIEKQQDSSFDENYFNIESYFLIGNGKDIYACHVDYSLYKPSGITFNNEVLGYFAISPRI